MSPALVINSIRTWLFYQTELINYRRDRYLCFAPSLNLLITLPRTIKLLLMCFPSFKRTPPAPVFAIRSDPAKSTKFWFQIENKRDDPETKVGRIKY